VPRPKASSDPGSRERSRTAASPSWARRGLACALLALVLLPWHRLVALRGSGPAVEQTSRLGDLYFGNVWIATLLTAAASFVLGFLIPQRAFVTLRERVEGALLKLGSLPFAALAGGIAAASALWTAAGVMDGKPALLDAVAQLVQARYLAAGSLAGPPLEDAEFWQFQFMLSGERGWVSQYPPGHTVLLALGLRLGAPWLVGPLLLGVAIALGSMVGERLLAEERAIARGGALLAASSPVLAFHAATYMNHVLALALTVLAVYASLRALDGSWAWSLPGGAALGWLFATRPYVALVLGAFATVVVWRFSPGLDGGSAPSRPTATARLDRRAWIHRVAGTLAGAAPFAAGTLLYNRHFFGAATRFGYEAAEGPGHALGFHIDPWGNPYGPLEALGYTSADLQGLSLDLLQAPVPVVVLVALYLLLAPRLRGVGVVAAWALLPVAANTFYWHHDLFMGPRLLYEALPAWCLLAAAAAVGVLRALPADGRRWGLSRAGVASGLMIALVVAVVYAAPRKLLSYAGEGARSGMTMAAPVVERAAIVFVHGGWLDRVAARLAASGMRVDSVRAALAHNSTCRLQLYLDRLEGSEGNVEGNPAARGASAEALPPGPSQLPPLAFQPPARPLLRELRMPSGSPMMSYQGEELDPGCEREAASDFRGVVGLPPLLWQGDLPGLDGGGALFVRDFGPERNRRLLARYPGREPRVLLIRDGALRLTAFDEGMRELWAADAAVEGGG
jgi:hypothetical protein